MSYNIDSIEIVDRDEDFHLPEGALFGVTLDDWVPESWEDGAALQRSLAAHRFPWTGECSGRGLDNLKLILSKFSGTADLVLCWEGGDDYSGLRLVNGVVTEHEVVRSLGKERK